MIEVPSSEDQVVLVGDFKGYSPVELFEHWVVPDQLTLWWPERAETDPRLGGAYRLEWPDLDWVLTGEYTEFVLGKRLGFTWQWNHEPARAEPLLVDVFFHKLKEGTRLSIFHRSFRPDEAEQRQGVLEGWIHFGMRLAGLRPPPRA